MKRLLIAEDEDEKFDRVSAVIRSNFLDVEIIRAANVKDCEELLTSDRFDALILDISMNICRGALGPARGGYANLGGMEVAERLFLFDIVLPTVIVTGFEYFQSSVSRSEANDMLSLNDLERRAEENLGDQLYGCIRYHSEGWETLLVSATMKALKE